MNRVSRTASEWLMLRFGPRVGSPEDSFSRRVEQSFQDDAALQHVARIVNGAAAPERFDVMPESAGLRSLIDGLHAQRMGEEELAERTASVYDALLAEIRARLANGERLESNPLLDPASGLPNRLLFLDRLQQAIIFAHRHNTLLAICSVRIEVTSVLPHIGAVTAEIADRLRNTIRELDTVGRLALDEFGIVANDLRLRDHAEVVVTKIAEILNYPYDIGERARIIPPRIGISFYPMHGHDAVMLLDRAREAAEAAAPVAVFGESAT